MLTAVARPGERGRIAPLARLAVYAALPLLGIVGSHFPALGRYIVSMLQPAMQAVR